MVKKLMIPLIAGSAVVVAVAAIAVPISIVNSQSTNNGGSTGGSNNGGSNNGGSNNGGSNNGGSLIASLRKWNIEDTQAIATQSLSISDITNSVIEFLYAKQDEFIKNINASYSVLKPTKRDEKNNYISFTIPVPYKDTSELNAFAKTYFLNENNWNDVISYCKSKNQNITDSSEIQKMEIVYSISKDATNENLVNVKPEQLVVLIENKEYLIDFSQERPFSSYTLFVGLNNNVNSGAIIEKGQNILRPMMLNQEIFDCRVFGDLNQNTESIMVMINKIKATDLIYLNRSTIFSNYNDLNNKDFISKVDATPVIEKSQISVEISYKNVNVKTNFAIRLSDDNLLRFSKLSDIKNWSNGEREIIDLGYSSISGDTVLDSAIQLINSRVKKEYKDYPHIDSFIKKIGGENNAFTMELNPNGIFNNSELLQQFPKIFSWLGQAWIQAVNALGTFPNINKIQNIIVEFNIQITGDLKLSTSVDAKIVPIKTTITFNTNTLSNIVWYFSKDLQNEKSYILSFENSTDNHKIQDTYLDNLRTWATPNNRGIALDDRTTTIGDVTSYITEYIYWTQHDIFGSIPQDTMPQVASKDKTNNRFYMKLKGKIISEDMVRSQFKRMWNLDWDQWKQKVKNNGQANRWIPDPNYISNMTIEYQVEEIERNLATGIMKYKVKPISISILYAMYGGNKEMTWYFSGDLQGKYSYDVALKAMKTPFLLNNLLIGETVPLY
ncbi:hypothetical protein ACJA29_02560 [Metamycoplasma sualvi]|uniref:hypothetical protein n=1 Tax=Metamycoplasma sualvi TaxID=2125 RepID=UPI003872FB06